MPPLLLLIAALAAVIAALVWKFNRPKPSQRPLQPAKPALPTAAAPRPLAQPPAPFPPRPPAPPPVTPEAVTVEAVPVVAAAPPPAAEPLPQPPKLAQPAKPVQPLKQLQPLQPLQVPPPPSPPDTVAPAQPLAGGAGGAGVQEPLPQETAPLADLVEQNDFMELSEFDAQGDGTPEALNTFAWMHESELPEVQRGELMEAIGGMPCPPQSLRQLLAPDFLERIGPVELAELLRGEPLLAAKVLATVNASFYGLSQPVHNIGHAVAFLGMETVRNICVQYLMAQAFRPELAASQRSFDSIWRASSMASELALRLGKALGLPDYGTLATKVVLAFVGHLATAALLPRPVLDEWMMRSRMERAQMEQDEIGVSAGELGPLVLRLWELPDSLVNDVSDSSRVLVTPASACDPKSVAHLALMYLCVGLGERLALGEMFALTGYDPAEDLADENYHLRSYLQDPALAGLNDVLASPEMAGMVQQMRGTGASWP